MRIWCAARRTERCFRYLKSIVRRDCDTGILPVYEAVESRFSYLNAFVHGQDARVTIKHIFSLHLILTLPMMSR